MLNHITAIFNHEITKLTQEASRLNSKDINDEDSLLNVLKSRHLPKGAEDINNKKKSIGKDKNINISKTLYTPPLKHILQKIL